MFEKKDLQVGQLVKLRDGSCRLVMPVGRKGALILLGEEGVWDYLNCWDDKLLGKSFVFEEGYPSEDGIDKANRMDIMVVYGLIEGTHNYGRMGYLEPVYRRVIWERKELSEIIAVDFDGTLCENKWPETGKPNWEVIHYLQRRKSEGAKLILWTCREGKRLRDALTWCKYYNLTFDAVNENLPESVKHFGEDSRKIYATEYIDDKNCTKFKLPFKAD